MDTTVTQTSCKYIIHNIIINWYFYYEQLLSIGVVMTYSVLYIVIKIIIISYYQYFYPLSANIS